MSGSGAGGNGNGSGSGSGDGSGSGSNDDSELRGVDMRPPENFEEEVRAENWQFEQYRLNGREILPVGQLGFWRSMWMNRPFPRLGRVPAIRGGRVARARINPMAPMGPKLPSLLSDSPRENDEAFEQARTRFRRAKTWFVDQGRFDFVRPLGYGGLGLTIQFRTQGDNPTDVVLKIALHGWIDDDLRREGRLTRQVSRAAHCIQMIDEEKIGMKKQEPYKLNFPEWNDSSSEDGISSGEESRDDEPPRPPPRTRRERMADPVEAERMRERRKRKERIYEEINDKQDERNVAMRRKHRGKGNPDDDEKWQLNHRDYLLLELVENGDLEKFVFKLNERNLMVPNRVLWSFWLCMVRACVAMEYPPRKFHPRRRPPPPPNPNDPLDAELARLILDEDDRDLAGKVVNGDLFEDVPGPRRRWAGKRMVHFDIDPRNIFIGGFDVGTGDDEHLLVPRLKLADFGVAMNVKPNKSNAYYQEKRFQAKHGYFAPEQFGVEWDYLALKDPQGPELSEQPVAGNWGAPMNVWGIALTLWTIITKSYPPAPPQRLPANMLNPREPLSYCYLLLSDDRYKDVDPDLKDVLVQCLRHDPADRPSLRVLLQQAKLGIRKRFDNESDATIRTWINDILYGADQN